MISSYAKLAGLWTQQRYINNKMLDNKKACWSFVSANERLGSGFSRTRSVSPYRLSESIAYTENKAIYLKWVGRTLILWKLIREALNCLLLRKLKHWYYFYFLSQDRFWIQVEENRSYCDQDHMSFGPNFGVKQATQVDWQDCGN